MFSLSFSPSCSHSFSFLFSIPPSLPLTSFSSISLKDTHHSQSYYYLFLSEQSCFTLLCQFLLYSKVNQPHVNRYTFLFEFPSHLGYYNSFLDYTVGSHSSPVYIQQCIYVNPNLPIHLPSLTLFRCSFFFFFCINIVWPFIT